MKAVAESNEWLLLIYVLPSQPTRKRAAVWRELKKLGALYLRDGVAVLPRLGSTEHALGELAQRIIDFDGEADYVVSPNFRPERSATFIERFGDEREEEYRELYRAGVRFLRDVLAEVDADAFAFPDVDKLDSELHRLHRWHEQISARDYFGGRGNEPVTDMLGKCDRAFETFAAEASGRLAGPTPSSLEDVFQRLSSRPNSADNLDSP